MCNDLIYIPEGDLFNIHQLSTDLVDDIIFMNKKGIWWLVQMWQSQNRVVVLNNDLEKNKNTQMRVKQLNLLLVYNPLATVISSVMT